MKLKPILTLLILLVSLTLPVMAADNEERLKITKTDGNSSADGSTKAADETSSSDKSDSSDADNMDVWGIQQSDMDFSGYVNMNLLGGIYSGITPLRNLSLISVAVSFGLALTFTIVGIFLLVLVAGYGAAHPNIKRGMEYITGSRSKIIALGGVFFLGLFMIILMFFFLYVFSRLSWFGM